MGAQTIAELQIEGKHQTAADKINEVVDMILTRCNETQSQEYIDLLQSKIAENTKTMKKPDNRWSASLDDRYRKSEE